MSAFHQPKPAKIASGETVGVAVDIRGQRVVGVKTPAALTGTTLTWQVADTADGPFHAAHHTSTLSTTATVITSIAAAQYLVLPFDKAPAGGFIKLVSGSAEAADRVFLLHCESL